MKSIRQTAWEINEWGERELEKLFSSLDGGATFHKCWDKVHELAKKHEWYTPAKHGLTAKDEVYKPFYDLAILWMRARFPERYKERRREHKDLKGCRSLFGGLEDGPDNTRAQGR